MRLNEIEGKILDPDLYEDIPPQNISRIAKNVFSKMYPDTKLFAKSTPEGYAEIYTQENEGNLYILIGCSVADGTISVNLSGGTRAASAGKFNGAITKMIQQLYASVVKKYGQPTRGELTIDNDASHGIWQHIANKIGLKYSAHTTK